MRNIYFTLLFSFTLSFVYAQKDFRKGYIIQNGDTIYGLVDYRGINRSAQLTTFKASETSEPKVYKPGDIEGYGFPDEQKVFELKKLPVSDTKTTVSDSLLFLNVLAKGQASLYFYRDNDQKDHFYLSKNNNPLIELLIQEGFLHNKQTGKKYKVQNDLYKVVLEQEFNDCPDIKKTHINKVNLAHNSLARITQNYNACMGNIVQSDIPENLTLKFGPVLALSSSKLDFSGPDILSKTPFKSTMLNLNVGATLSLSSPSLSEKLSIVVDLLYSSSKFSTNIQEVESASGTNMYESWFDIKYLKLPAQVRYTYPRNKLKPFFNAGPMIGYAIDYESETRRISTFAGKNRINIKPALNDSEFRKYTVGITAGAGLLYSLYNKPLSLEARYERTNGISNIITLASKIETFYIIMSYNF